MAYRRTERVLGRLAARREDILAAARDAAAEEGFAAVQIAPVAARAGIAAGTVYRYFPGKADLLAALLGALATEEVAAIRAAADASPGPLSALAAAIATFAASAARRPRLVAGALVETVEIGLEDLRIAFRRALTAEFAGRIRSAVAAGHLPEQDADLGAAAIVGALVEATLGPLAAGSARSGGPAQYRQQVQALALLALRALGVADARARGLVVQLRTPAEFGG
jgi:AcrR family transcriptional regulator